MKTRSYIPLVLLLCLPACGAWAKWHEDTQPIMGTRVQVEVWQEDDGQGDALLRMVMAEMRRLDALLSPYIETSELSRLNRGAAQSAIPVGPELYMLLERSRRISELTNGAFDVTYASVGRYYDYRRGVRPSDATIQAGLDAIDYRYVLLDPLNASVRYAHAAVHVDLGGIAKGYAVDRCVELLLAKGVTHAMVAAGGDSRIVGDRRGQPWSVGVKDPRDPERMAAILPLQDVAVSTSGDYERYFDEAGVRYHHILDPGTGDSAREVRSVTILGPDATYTDALSTSVFVLGVQRGLALVNGLPGVDAILVDAQGELLFSADLLELPPPGKSG